jgi:hypothetical protein
LDQTPPSIYVDDPKNGETVTKPEILLSGKVSDNVVVASLVFSLNGSAPRALSFGGEKAAWGGTSSKRVRPFLQSLRLREGRNSLKIFALDEAGNQAIEDLIVDYLAGASNNDYSPVSIRDPREYPEKWALLIGIGAYDDSRIPDLKYSPNDARELYEVLTERGGFKKTNVRLLTDGAEAPDLRTINKAFSWLRRKAARDDLVLVYFSGHGAPETDLSGANKDGLRKYLIPGDAELSDLAATAIDMYEIRRLFRTIEADRVVFFADTCYSGAVGGRTFRRPGMRAINLTDEFLNRLTESKGRIILTASSVNEVAIESDELKHGIFTYYLLEALEGRGGVDMNHDRILSLPEVIRYVQNKVSRKARDLGGLQHPTMKGEYEGDFPILIIEGQQSD